MKKIFFTILVILLVGGAFLLGKNFDKDKSNENNKMTTEENSENNNTKKEENNQSSTSDESTNSKNIVKSKYYKSDDNKYHLILNEYYREGTSSKLNDTKRNFVLTIDRHYDLIDLYGTYTLNENGTIELIIEHGCTASDGSWNCNSNEIPEGVKVVEYMGNHKIVINYNDNKISFGNVELILNNESTNSKNIVESKYYKSNDNKYHLILNEYYHEGTSSKLNDTKRNFVLTIDRHYDLIDLYGTYTLNENGTIELIIEHGCTASDGSWNCDSSEIPEEVKVVENMGNHKIVINYNDNKISFGNVELILK